MFCCLSWHCIVMYNALFHGMVLSPCLESFWYISYYFTALWYIELFYSLNFYTHRNSKQTYAKVCWAIIWPSCSWCSGRPLRISYWTCKEDRNPKKDNARAKTVWGISKQNCSSWLLLTISSPGVSLKRLTKYPLDWGTPWVICILPTQIAW